MKLETKKYKRAILFSGGGTRFSIYLGMYAALNDLNLKPDLIIASCGGAIAATIITAFPEIASQRNYIKSQELYSFIKNIELTNQKALSKLGFFAIRKSFNKQSAPIIEDVLNKYLVIVSQNLQELPSINNINFNDNTLIIGSKILFTKSEVNKNRENNKLYKKIIFGNSDTINSIETNRIEIISKNYFNSAVTSQIETSSQFNLSQAMRISISDMFYVEPFYSKNISYSGGVIDLVPIELAKYLASEIIMEKKQKYSFIESGLIRSVLGFDPNKRLQEVNSHNINNKIDTTNANVYLKGNYFSKSINWKKFQLTLNYPTSYAHFCKAMDMQWQYGYNQTIQAFKL